MPPPAAGGPAAPLFDANLATELRRLLQQAGAPQPMSSLTSTVTATEVIHREGNPIPRARIDPPLPAIVPGVLQVPLVREVARNLQIPQQKELRSLASFMSYTFNLREHVSDIAHDLQADHPAIAERLTDCYEFIEQLYQLQTQRFGILQAWSDAPGDLTVLRALEDQVEGAAAFDQPILNAGVRQSIQRLQEARSAATFKAAAGAAARRQPGGGGGGGGRRNLPPKANRPAHDGNNNGNNNKQRESPGAAAGAK